MTNIDAIRKRLESYRDELEECDDILMMQAVYVRDVDALFAELDKLYATWLDGCMEVTELQRELDEANSTIANVQYQALQIAGHRDDLIFERQRDAVDGQNSLDEANAEIARLKEEVESERIRLSACGVAAMSNTKKTVAERITKDNPYYSASYGDVCDAVDREMKYRADLARLTEENERLKREVEFIKTLAEDRKVIAEGFVEDLAALYKRLAEQGNELDTLRKVVWFLEPTELLLNRKGWWLDSKHGLDIGSIQRGMGK